MVGSLELVSFKEKLSSSAGLTETSTTVTSSAVHDIWFGSSGSLLPGIKAKIMSIEGTELTGYDQPGELVVKSPSVVLGYLNNPKANKETFQDGWLRTGDEAVVRKSPNGYEHIFIVDRIKELIKVNVWPKINTLSQSWSTDSSEGSTSGTCRARSTHTCTSIRG